MTTTQATATTAGSPGTSPHPRAPWSTVLPLAVVAAYGSGFWLIVIRGAVGAIERTQAPFATWLEESTLLLPLYVFAVIAALTLALRWFGRGPRRAREVALTLLLVALAATLAATVVQAVSAVFDYRLQTTQVTNMAAHMPFCGTRCIAEQQRAGLVLQLHALGLGSLVMLVSNVVLLAVVIGLRGGRLDLGSSSRPQAGRAGRVARFDNLDRFLLATLLGAAAIHASVIRGHLAQWPLGGIAFLLLTVAEVDMALLFLLRLRFMHFLGTAVVSAAPLLVWLYARTAGLPFGPHVGVVQPLGLTDTTAALLEAATLVVAIAALRRDRPPRPAYAQYPARLALTGVVAVSVIGAAVGVGALGGVSALPQHQTHHHHASV